MQYKQTRQDQDSLLDNYNLEFLFFVNLRRMFYNALKSFYMLHIGMSMKYTLHLHLNMDLNIHKQVRYHLHGFV